MSSKVHSTKGAERTITAKVQKQSHELMQTKIQPGKETYTAGDNFLTCTLINKQSTAAAAEGVTRSILTLIGEIQVHSQAARQDTPSDNVKIYQGFRRQQTLFDLFLDDINLTGTKLHNNFVCAVCWYFLTCCGFHHDLVMIL